LQCSKLLFRSNQWTSSGFRHVQKISKNELWKTAFKENIPFVELSKYQLQYYPRWYTISARHIPFCFEHLRVKASCDGCRFQASTIVVGAYSRFCGDILWPCLVVSPTCSCCLIKS
jgi:hypothetical protein